MHIDRPGGLNMGVLHVFCSPFKGDTRVIKGYIGLRVWVEGCLFLWSP